MYRNLYCEQLRLLHVNSLNVYINSRIWVPPTHSLAHRYLQRKSMKGTASLTTIPIPSPPPTRGCILGRNWDKNLKTFALCYSQSSSPIIRNASKGGKPNRKPRKPYSTTLWFQKSIQNNQTMKKTQVCS
jgi:hypothetical protein